MEQFILADKVAWAAFREALRVDTWRGMMKGHIPSWCSFFKMIETGESKTLLREHVKYG